MCYLVSKAVDCWYLWVSHIFPSRLSTFLLLWYNTTTKSNFGWFWFTVSEENPSWWGRPTAAGSREVSSSKADTKQKQRELTGSGTRLHSQSPPPVMDFLPHNFPEQSYQLGTNYSHTQTYGGHFSLQSPPPCSWKLGICFQWKNSCDWGCSSDL